MNWFTCNYINLVVNVLYMLLMLSPSMSTSLLDIRRTFHLKLSITTISLISNWSVCCTCYLTLYDETVASEWTTSSESVHVLLCCVFLAKLGLIHFNLELTFTSFPLQSVETSHTPPLTHYISHTLATVKVILLAFVRHCGQGITLRPAAGNLTPNSLRSNWDFLPGRSPWHVGGSNTVNRWGHHIWPGISLKLWGPTNGSTYKQKQIDEEYQPRGVLCQESWDHVFRN